MKRGKVYFIGAGPGDPELITVKGKKIIQKADLVLYTGSLVPKDVVLTAKKGARVVDSSSMTLDEIHNTMMETINNGGIVARVHTGDPSIYGTLNEQIRLLEKEGVPYEIIPGVTAAFALAAEAKISLTIPEVTQTVIFARISGKTYVPDRERLKELSSHKASLAIYLSASNPSLVKKELIEGGYPEDTLVIIGYRVGWPDQKILKCELKDMDEVIKEEGIKRQAVFLIIPKAGDTASKLYDPEFEHGFRKRKK